MSRKRDRLPTSAEVFSGLGSHCECDGRGCWVCMAVDHFAEVKTEVEIAVRAIRDKLAFDEEYQRERKDGFAAMRADGLRFALAELTPLMRRLKVK